MNRLNHRLGQYVVVAPLLLLCGCDQIKRVLPQRDDANYELRQDEQGRIIRLNRVTGEVAIVNGATLIPVIPVKPAGEKSRPARTAGRVETPTLAEAPRETPRPPQPPPSDAAVSTGTPPTFAPEVVFPPSIEPSAGSTLTVASPSPLFLTANSNRMPLLVMATGTVVRFLGTEGEWYHVEMDDPRWGPRQGFVRRKDMVDPRLQVPTDGTRDLSTDSRK